MDVRSLSPHNKLHRWFPDNKRVTSFNSCVDRWFHTARDQVTSSQDMFARIRTDGFLSYLFRRSMPTTLTASCILSALRDTAFAQRSLVSSRRRTVRTSAISQDRRSRVKSSTSAIRGRLHRAGFPTVRLPLMEADDLPSCLKHPTTEQCIAPRRSRDPPRAD